MKSLKYIVGLCLILITSTANAQNFKADLKKLNNDVEAAYKNKKLTEVEYIKLKEEHDIIQQAIDKAAAIPVILPVRAISFESFRARVKPANAPVNSTSASFSPSTTEPI